MYSCYQKLTLMVYLRRWGEKGTEAVSTRKIFLFVVSTVLVDAECRAERPGEKLYCCLYLLSTLGSVFLVSRRSPIFVVTAPHIIRVNFPRLVFRCNRTRKCGLIFSLVLRFLKKLCSVIINTNNTFSKFVGLHHGKL